MNIVKETKFWVVTLPKKDSTLADILFESDLRYLYIQFRGGLIPDDIKGLYESKQVATDIAKSLL